MAQDIQEVSNFSSSPRWVKAADNHNIGSANSSIYSYLDDPEEASINPLAHIAVSAISGIHSIFNSAYSVVNYLGADIDIQDTGELITEFDDDLGKYYADHRQSADTIGFVAASFIPGLGSVRALKGIQGIMKASSAGSLGTNMSRATGLLVPKSDIFIKQHAAELASRSATWKLFQANTVKTVAEGVKQGVLEGVAWEAAVFATMHKSPVLDDASAYDLIRNMTIGTIIGGGLGGFVTGAQSYSRVTSLLKGANARQLQFATGTTNVTKHRFSLSDDIIAASDDIERLSEPVTPEMVKASKEALGETGESVSVSALASETQHLNILRDRTINTLETKILGNVRKLSASKLNKVDEVDSFGLEVHDLVSKVANPDKFNIFDRMDRYVRLGDASEFDKKLASYLKTNKMTKKDLKGLNKSEIEQLINTTDTTAYVQLHSGEHLSLLNGAPTNQIRLADNATPQGIQEFIAKQGFHIDRAQDFSSTKLAPKVAEARWIWARGMIGGLKAKSVVRETDLPMLDLMIRQGTTKPTIISAFGEPLKLNTVEEVKALYRQSQIRIAKQYAEQGRSAEFIELFTDIRKDALGSAAKNSVAKDDLFRAQHSYAKELEEVTGSPTTALDLHNMPKYMKASYQPDMVVDGNLLKGMQALAYQKKLNEEAADLAVAEVIGPLARLLDRASPEQLRKQWSGGSGQGNIHNAGGAYGSLESWVSSQGNVTLTIEKDAIAKLTEEARTVTQALLSDSEAAVRFSALNEKIASLPDMYHLSDDGLELIHEAIYKAAKEAQAAAAKGDEFVPPAIVLGEGLPESIPVHPSIATAVSTHVGIANRQLQGFKSLANSKGNSNTRNYGVFRPVRRDSRQYKHHAFVRDDTVSGAGHVKMIVARDGDSLEKLISEVPSPYKVVTDTQTTAYFKARDEYLYENTLHENYLDIELATKGKMTDFFPMTDPQLLADTTLQYYTRQETALLREAIKIKHAEFISQSEKLGDLYSAAHSSSTDTAAKLAVSTKKNPFMAQVKSVLNQTRLEDAPDWWLDSQTKLDRGVSVAYNRTKEIILDGLGKNHLTDEIKLAEINQIFDEVGQHSAYYTAATNILANQKIDQGVLTSFVRTADAFLINTVLRLDMFNAGNNFLGNNVIMSAEVTSLIDAIKKADPKVAGKLAELSEIAVPGGGGSTIFSSAKVIKNAYTKAFEVMKNSETKPTALYTELKLRGLVPDMADQLYRGLDTLTLVGVNHATDIASRTAKLKQATTKAVQAGAKYTGNELVERTNRVHAALVMKSFTDLALEAGILKNADEAWPYINTFVNRLNGTIRAAERPLMFQGPIGQAMGLFQTYQLNLIQQTLRHVGEGRGKTMAIMGGMQASIYGASSLPAFNYINTSLLGNAYGNTEHQDLFSGTQTAIGKEAAEWLMYGAPSNLLNAALYTRGNTNPRTWHVVPNPTNPSEIPFISTFAQTVGSIRTAAESVADGASLYDGFLSALEHTGLSRPLSGLATTARGITNEGVAFSTQKSGGFLFENDMLSIATLMRIAGAKPLDEAVAQNNYYRITGYAAGDIKNRQKLGVAMKAVIRENEVPDAEAINNFTAKYMELGGTQKGFNSFYMNQYKKATTSQAELLSQKLQNPYGRQMQKLFSGGVVEEGEF